jgi:hypothetical protein
MDTPMLPPFLPFCLALVIWIIWGLTCIQSWKLLALFKSKYPQAALEEIPHAFDYWRHPRKFFFVFRKKCVPLLRSEPLLWKNRQRLLALLTISILFPLVSFVTLVIMAVLNAHR